MKKGELEMQETIMVVLIFVILMIGGMIFYYKFEMSSIEQDYQDNLQIKFQALRDVFPNVAELKCSVRGASEDCIDVYKVLVFNGMFNVDKDRYIKRYGFMNITLSEVYPEENSKECKIGDFKDCGFWQVYEHLPADTNQRRVLETPVSLYDPSEESYSVGVLRIYDYNQR
jgi:hypothetical protein